MIEQDAIILFIVNTAGGMWVCSTFKNGSDKGHYNYDLILFIAMAVFKVSQSLGILGKNLRYCKLRD